MNIEQLKYPIGKYQPPPQITTDHRTGWIDRIASLPERIISEVAQLDSAQLDRSYRPGGWSGRQVIHHLVDSHLNAYARFKWALTEDQPTIKPYFEERWAELPDGSELPVEASLKALDGLHARLAYLLRSMSEQDFKKGFMHPEHGRVIPLDYNLGMYAWHGDHHLAHLKLLHQK